MLKIPCGGFELDESSFSLENKKLSTQPVSWNDLTDKPFGEETGKVAFLPETEVNFVNQQGQLVAMSQGERIPLVSGQLYTVVWNGAEYNCVAQTLEREGMQVILLGDASVMGLSGNGEPFLFYTYSEESYEASGGIAWAAMSLDGSTTVKLSIIGDGTIVNQIDRKYIPQDVFFVTGVEVEGVDAYYKADATFDELLEAHNAGKELVFIVPGKYQMTNATIDPSSEIRFESVTEFLNGQIKTLKVQFTRSGMCNRYENTYRVEVVS